MNSIRETEQLISRFHVTSSAEMDERIYDDILQVLERTKQKLSATPQPSLRRKIMETIKVRNKVAVLCCILFASVAAAIVVSPSVYDTIYSFIYASAEKDTSGLVELADPMSAVPDQVEDLLDLEKTSELELVSLYADNEFALAVTTNVVHVDEVYDGGRKEGPLVITLERRDAIWLVTDIDLETEVTATDEVDRFISKHPDAVNVSL